MQTQAGRSNQINNRVERRMILEREGVRKPYKMSNDFITHYADIEIRYSLLFARVSKKQRYILRIQMQALRSWRAWPIGHWCQVVKEISSVM